MENKFYKTGKMNFLIEKP